MVGAAVWEVGLRAEADIYREGLAADFEIELQRWPPVRYLIFGRGPSLNDNAMTGMSDIEAAMRAIHRRMVRSERPM